MEKNKPISHQLVFNLGEIQKQGANCSLEDLPACTQCGFTLHNGQCFACSSEPPTSEEKSIEFNVKRAITPLPPSCNDTLYLFCLDNSGSVQVTYNYEMGNSMGMAVQGLDMLQSRLSKQSFQKLVNGCNHEALRANQEFLAELIEGGMTVESILEMEELKGGKKEVVSQHKSRKEIMKEFVMDTLRELKKDESCGVVITFFNEKLASEGMGSYQLVMFGEGKEAEAFREGKKQANKVKVYKPEKFGKIQNLFDSYESEGGTALGPAIVFNCGIISQLKYPRNQIILITDGASNLGFGQMEDIKKQSETQAYNTSQLYAKIAENYLVPHRIMMNVMGFSDSQIKMYIMNKFMNISGSISNLLMTNSKSKGGPVLSAKEEKKTKSAFKNDIVNLPKQRIWGGRFAFVASHKGVVLENKEFDQKEKEVVSFRCGVMEGHAKMGLRVGVPEDLVEEDLEIVAIMQYEVNGVQVRCVEKRVIQKQGKKKGKEAGEVEKEEMGLGVGIGDGSDQEQQNLPRTLKYETDEKTSYRSNYYQDYSDDD